MCGNKSERKFTLIYCGDILPERRADISPTAPTSASGCRRSLIERKGWKDMSRREQYEARTESLLLPIVDGLGFELVDVEYVKEGGSWYLRAYIDKDGGITVDDCEAVSRAFSDILDREDYIDDSYIFEVSSPGLGRPLKKEKDFRRNMGAELEVRTYKAVDGQKEFYGILTAYDGNGFTIVADDETEIVFEKKEVALVRPVIEF